MMRRQSRHLGYPHPYFVGKFLCFMRLQGGLRCKIVKTKKFPAKSSRIRSYGDSGQWTVVSGQEKHGSLVGGHALIVRAGKEIMCKGLAVQADALRVWGSWSPRSPKTMDMGHPGNPPVQSLWPFSNQVNGFIARSQSAIKPKINCLPILLERNLLNFNHVPQSQIAGINSNPISNRNSIGVKLRKL